VPGGWTRAAFDDMYYPTKPAGIGQAVFVDYSKEACRTIEENLDSCAFEGRSLVVSTALSLAASAADLFRSPV